MNLENVSLNKSGNPSIRIQIKFKDCETLYNGNITDFFDGEIYEDILIENNTAIAKIIINNQIIDLQASVPYYLAATEQDYDSAQLGTGA